MEMQISHWGNSLGIRIPKFMADELGIESGSKLDVVLENDRLVLTPVEDKKTLIAAMAGMRDLESMVACVTTENQPDIFDEEFTEGKEIW
jgi:antitoxin MazE